MRTSRRAFLATAGSAAAVGRVGGRPVETLRGAAGKPSLLLNWKPSGLHVPYYAAKAKGFYADEGVPLSGIESGQGSDFSAKQVGIGNTEFAITSSDQVVNVNSRRLSPLAVGVVMQKSPVVVFTVRGKFGGTFTDVEQLKGKTVGTGPGMVRILTKLLLERRGVLKDVTLVDTGYDTVQRLLAGKIDAAGGVFGDAIDARHQGATIDSVPVASAVPSYGHVVATNDSFAGKRPKAVASFLRATARGAAWAQRNPKAAIGALVDAVPSLEASRAIEREKWETMANGFMLSDAVRRQGWGWSEPKPWNVTYRALRGAGLLGGTVDPKTVWTNDRLDTDYRYIGSYADVVDSN